MYCPKCKIEYRESYSRCAECGGALLPRSDNGEFGQETQQASSDEAPRVLRRGHDPVTYSAILSALCDSGIPYFDSNRADYTASLSSPLTVGFYGLPYWQIFVHQNNLEAARRVLEVALRPQPSLEADSAEKLAPQSDAKSNTEPHTPKEKAALFEVWNGSDTSCAESLRALLVDNGVPCWESSGAAGQLHLYVPAEFQARARAIVGPELARAQSA